MPRLHRTARLWIYVLAALVAAALLAACAAYQHQHQGAAPPPAEPAPAAAPVSGEFSQLSNDEQVARVRGEVEEAKANLHRQGKYACCVHPACNQCLLQHGECQCRHAVEKEGGPCCGECTEAWIEGKGTVEGISALELLERKKREIRDEGTQEPPQHRHHHP